VSAGAPTPRRRLSALIVNHDSGSWAVRCVESLMLDWRRSGREPEDLEVIVFDSGSKAGEGTWWRSLHRLGVRVVTSQENRGYASGLDEAWRRSSGESSDHVALLNPDLYFLPGSLDPLLETLEQRPRVGAVAPRLFVDEARQILLPPNRLPGPLEELGELLAARWPRFARALAANRSRSAHRWWTIEERCAARMLSGACLFLRREVIEELGVPMDPGYPLYFEDADLCARLSAAGRSLLLEPRSEVLHHWSRCAGPSFEGEVARRWQESRARWMSVWHDGLVGRGLRALVDRSRRWLEGLPVRAMHEVVDLGTLVESPEIEFSAAGRGYVLELSATPFFGLSAGILCEGERYRMPARTWSWLFPGTYYLRALEARSGKVLGAWRFEKTSAARSWPLDPSSLPGPRPRERRRVAGERVG